ncbi:MAG: S8 family peptidase [Acidimicrobiales bacterium]
MAYSNDDQDNGGPSYPTGPWTDRVQFVDEAGSRFAFRPGEVLTTRVDAAERTFERVFPGAVQPLARGERVGAFTRLSNVPDVRRLIDELRFERITAQPNHVFFAHGCCGGCPPHPAAVAGNPVYASPVYASPVYASPVYASPVYASPVYASPVYASPVYASPVYASPVYASPSDPTRATGVRKSSARPAVTPPPANVVAGLATAAAPGNARVVILDTGLAGTFPPLALAGGPYAPATTADTDGPDEFVSPATSGDGQLDPAAGHGTFIAGLVNQVAPGSVVELHRVLSTFGDGDERDIVQTLNGLSHDPAVASLTIVNLSFGGSALDHPFELAEAIRDLQAAGAVVVASAGNDGSCEATFPAALPGVVGVGALGPNGPAPFSNYGPWVRACAPGVDLVSTFFDGFTSTSTSAGTDPEAFGGWATWSGSSFAGPVVVGALARMMKACGCTAKEAVERVVDAPWLYRIPNLGTVVNVV